jgi:hypothetical protein
VRTPWDSAAGRPARRAQFAVQPGDLPAVIVIAAPSPRLQLLSPLRVGSGTKIKVLEALARGLPVVA